MAVADIATQARAALDPDLFRIAVDLCPHGIAIRDADQLVYKNAAWESLVTSEPCTGRESSSRHLVTSTRVFEYCGRPFSLCLAHDLTDRVAAERRPQEAQKLEALGRWVGGVVHDFNNLLTAVMLYSDMVDQAAEPGSAIARFNNEIRDVAKRGAGLAGQLLAFVQQRPHERSIIPANSLLKGLRDVLGRMIGEDVSLSFELAQYPCYVQMDPAQLQQVVFNLALNARDAMPRGGRLSIRTSEHQADLGRGLQECVSVAVTDTGEGMDDATRAHIFEPFFTTKPQGKGTGLGLTIVQEIIAETGGTVNVETEPGSGTTVTLTVPRAEPPHTRDVLVPLRAQSSRCTETILVAEDDAALRSSIVSTLERRGYQVIEAANAAEALEMTNSSAFTIHLLISDLVLPGISGRELARRMLQKRPQIRVLFMSGYGLAAPDDLCPSETYFEKPFNGEALATQVRQTLATTDVSGTNDSVRR